MFVSLDMRNINYCETVCPINQLRSVLIGYTLCKMEAIFYTIITFMGYVKMLASK